MSHRCVDIAAGRSCELMVDAPTRCVVAYIFIPLIAQFIYLFYIFDAERPLTEMENKGNVLFNDTLNTFYFTVIWRRTYGKGPLG